jgi:hypothetical protein
VILYRSSCVCRGILAPRRRGLALLGDDPMLIVIVGSVPDHIRKITTRAERAI